MQTRDKREILSGLKYHGYCLLIVHIDAERFSAVRDASDTLYPFLEPNRIFTRECRDSRKNLTSTLQSFVQQVSKRQSKKASDKDRGEFEEEFEQFLYNPACFVGIGETDNIALVGVDEFERAAHLSSLVNI